MVKTRRTTTMTMSTKDIEDACRLWLRVKCEEKQPDLWTVELSSSTCKQGYLGLGEHDVTVITVTLKKEEEVG